MDIGWYYFRGKQRFGPVSFEELLSLISDGTLTQKSYVWRKGFADWRRVESVDELHEIASPPVPDETYVPEVPKDNNISSSDSSTLPPLIRGVNWSKIDENKKMFLLKIGLDRDSVEQEYGPYSLNQLRRIYSENRINSKTLIFVPGMDNWKFFSNLPIYRDITGSDPNDEELPQELCDDKRSSIRKPFVARMYFHDSKDLYEGVCRDISVGGMQVLVSNFPCSKGDMISLNVHPDNSLYSFTARGEIVRILDGDRGFSIRFNDLNKEAVSSINAYIKSNS